MSNRSRPLAAEGLGTAALVAAIVGSGVMAERLTGDPALALLANSLATAAMLVVLIALFAPLSGAHFNPAVSLAMALSRALPWRMFAAYVAVQIAAGVVGTVTAHLMFDLPAVTASLKARGGTGTLLSEAVATFGLTITVLGARGLERTAAAWLVGLYILAAYWFTASTSFANPAVTIARSLTDTFSGIRPLDAPAFVAAELAGAVVGYIAASRLLRGEVGTAADP